jgi:NADPH2:quinone reductase
VGYEFAGRIHELGSGVSGFTLGQAIWGLLPVRGTRWGAYAEYVVVDAQFVASRPGGLEPVAAGAIPLPGSTAYQLLDRLELREGDWLLVHGAAGGVGSLLVQLAHARGLRVVGSASKQRHALLRQLGVEIILDRESDNVVALAVRQVGSHLGAVADLVGQGLLARSLTGIREGGAAASIVELSGDFEEAVDRNITLHGLLVQPRRETLDRLSDAVNSGSLRPVIGEVFDFTSAVEAHRRMERGHSQGRAVLRFDRTP